MPFTWLIKQINHFQIITAFIGFLLVHKFIILAFIFYIGGEELLRQWYSALTLWKFIVAVPAGYLLWWLIIVWIGSKFTPESFKEKFYRHPIAAILLTLSYLYDLPYRLSEVDFGAGVMQWINGFETAIFYVFINFLWFLLIAWISEKVWKQQKFEWIWYKKIVNQLFNILPIVFKLILGLLIAIFIVSLIFVLFVGAGYDAADLRAIF